MHRQISPSRSHETGLDDLPSANKPSRSMPTGTIWLLRKALVALLAASRGRSWASKVVSKFCTSKAATRHRIASTLKVFTLPHFYSDHSAFSNWNRSNSSAPTASSTRSGKSTGELMGSGRSACYFVGHTFVGHTGHKCKAPHA